MISRISFTPESTTESERKQALAWAATSRPSVVFPVPGGPQKIYGVGAAGLDRGPQRLAGAEDVLLADEFVEGTRAHAVGEGARRVVGGVEESGLCSCSHLASRHGYRCRACRRALAKSR